MKATKSHLNNSASVLDLNKVGGAGNEVKDDDDKWVYEEIPTKHNI